MSVSILQLDGHYEDKRGMMFFLSYGKKKFNLIEIKKGFARGGHYHDYSQQHTVISGKIEYRQKDPKMNKEIISIIKSPNTIKIPRNIAHVLIALENSLIIEDFDKNYEITTFPEYRKIVEQMMCHK